MPDEPDPLQSLIADILEAEYRGEPVDRDAFVNQHPEHAESLREFFANHDSMKADSHKEDVTLPPFSMSVFFSGALVLSLLAAYLYFFSPGARQARALRLAQTQVQMLGGTLSKAGSSGPTPFSSVSVYMLDFKGTQLTDRQLASLASHLHGIYIRQLKLDGTKVTDASVDVLARLQSSLKYAIIDITNSGITKKGESRIREQLPFGKILNASSRNSFRHSECLDLVFSNRGESLAVVERKVTNVYDLASSKKVVALAGGNMATYSADDSMLALAGGDGSVVWDLSSHRPVWHKEGTLNTLAFNSSNTSLYSWDFQVVRQLTFPTGEFQMSLVSTLIGRSCDLNGSDPYSKLSDIFVPDSGRRQSPNFHRSFDFPSNPALSVVSSNAIRYAWGDNSSRLNGAVTIVDLVSKKTVGRIDETAKCFPSTGMFDGEADRLAIGSTLNSQNSRTGLVQVFEVSSGIKLFEHREPFSCILKVALSTDGKRVAGAFDTGLVQWWRVPE